MRRLFWGVAIILLGVWLWLSSLGISWISFSRDWPVLLVLFGGYVIYRNIRKLRRKRRRQVRFILDDIESGRVNVEEAIDRIKRRK